MTDPHREHIVRPLTAWEGTVPREYDLRSLHGPFDIIGDVQGCLDELLELVQRLGYRLDEQGVVHHPKGRMLVFVGDLIDLGPDSLGALTFAMNNVREGTAVAIRGNHEDELLEALSSTDAGRHPWYRRRTMQALSLAPAGLKAALVAFMEGLPHQLFLDGGKLVITHAGVPEKFLAETGSEAKQRSLRLPPSGRPYAKGEHWVGWAPQYKGPLQVHGHEAVGKVVHTGHVVNVDSGCMFGHRLSAFRYPEMTVRSVQAHAPYIKDRFSDPFPKFPWEHPSGEKSL